MCDPFSFLFLLFSFWTLLTHAKQASLVSIVCMNYSLAYSSVGFYQIAKLFCIPVTIALEKIFGFRQQGFSLILVASLVLLCIGMALIVEQEMDTNIIGLFWTIAGVISTSVAQVFFGPLKKRLDLGALQLLFHTSPFMAVGCFVAVPLLEDTKELYSMKISSGLISMIILSCLIAVTFNNSNYMLLSEITPLTYTVLSPPLTLKLSYIFIHLPISSFTFLHPSFFYIFSRYEILFPCTTNRILSPTILSSYCNIVILILYAH